MSDKKLDELMAEHKPLPSIVYPVREHFGWIIDAEDRTICRGVGLNGETIAQTLNDRAEVDLFLWLLSQVSWLGFQMPLHTGPQPSNITERSFSANDIAKGKFREVVERLRTLKEGR